MLFLHSNSHLEADRLNWQNWQLYYYYFFASTVLVIVMDLVVSLKWFPIFKNRLSSHSEWMHTCQWILIVRRQILSVKDFLFIYLFCCSQSLDLQDAHQHLNRTKTTARLKERRSAAASLVRYFQCHFVLQFTSKHFRHSWTLIWIWWVKKMFYINNNDKRSDLECFCSYKP